MKHHVRKYKPSGVCYYETEWMCCDCRAPGIDCINEGRRVEFHFRDDYVSEYEERANAWEYGVKVDPHS